jgi:peptide/nickel transport system permease protein
MAAFVIRRLLQGLLVLWIVSIFIFLALHLLPGDPLVYYIDESTLVKYTPEQRAALEHELGLDKPLPLQYVDWMSDIFHGDLGTSLQYHQKVTSLLRESLPISLHLGTIAFLISGTAGIMAGVICATRRGKWLDTVLNVLANVGITIPIFWLGVLLVYLFSLKLGWLPVMGYTSPFDNFVLSIRQTIMPIFCLSIAGMAGLTRQTRSSMLEVLQQDYVRTAWSKGLKEHSVIVGHTLKNGLIPVVTILGIQARNIVGGAVLIESVFNIPGIGRLVAQAAFCRDYPIVQGVTLVVALVVVLLNLTVDLSYGWLDPRIRY